MKYERGSFITVGSRDTLRGLHPTAQALYMWLSSYANETGNCFPSRKTLAEDVGCAERTVDAMVDLLCEKGLVEVKGRKEGDKQLSNLYKVLIIPPLASPATPPSSKCPTPLQDLRTNSIQLTQSKEDSATRIEIVSDEEEKPRARKDTSYLEVFREFSPRVQGWYEHKPQIEAAKRLLKQKGIEQIRKALEYYREHKDEPYMVEIHTPYDLEAKWAKLVAKSKKS